MAGALTDGGMMLHEVDLRDHNMFSRHFHELKFYEVPDRMYYFMTKSAGYPNRVLINQYHTIIQQTKLDYKFLITRLAGVGEIKPYIPYDEIPCPLRKESLNYVRSVRKRFASSFASLSDEDLSITGFFLIAKNIGNTPPLRGQ